MIAILRACEDARFSPDAAGIEEARETSSRAQAVLDGVSGAPGGSKSA